MSHIIVYGFGVGLGADVGHEIVSFVSGKGLRRILEKDIGLVVLNMVLEGLEVKTFCSLSLV